MRIHTELPEWMTHGYLEGNEGEGGTGTEGAGTEGAGGTGTGTEGQKPEGKTDEEDPDHSDLDDKDLSGLKNGIKSEREITRATKKELREAQTKLKEAEARLKEIDDKDKSEAEKAKEAQTKADAKVAKLAEGYKNSALKSAVEKAARELKFLDPEDAYTGIDLKSIEVEQDDDDPADVKVSDKQVKSLVKALSEKKPYLIGDETTGDPSGSKFGGGKKSKDEISVEELKKKYPSLR